jgi:hypothetical protein
MRGLAPKFTRKRAYLIFPVRGSERRGLVSVEAKKRKGKVSTDQPGKSHHGPKREQEWGLRQRADVMVGNEVVREDLALLLVPSSCTSFFEFCFLYVTCVMHTQAMSTASRLILAWAGWRPHKSYCQLFEHARPLV